MTQDARAEAKAAADSLSFAPVDTLRSPKLTAVVADMLRRKIISGELREGDNLPPEPDLVGQLGVSRPTLREALRVLESESLIRPRRGSRTGAQVCAPSAAMSARYMGFVLQHERVTVEDVLEARRTIEPPLAGLAARMADAAGVARLKKAFEDEESALDDNRAFGEASIHFHETVMELSGSKTLALCIRQINWVLGRLTEEVETRGDDGGTGNPRAHRSHGRFIAYIEAGDADGAESYWHAHVEEIGRVLLRKSRSEGKSVIDLFS